MAKRKASASVRARLRALRQKYGLGEFKRGTRKGGSVAKRRRASGFKRFARKARRTARGVMGGIKPTGRKLAEGVGLGVLLGGTGMGDRALAGLTAYWLEGKDVVTVGSAVAAPEIVGMVKPQVDNVKMQVNAMSGIKLFG